jgi:hypothetical protein
MTAAVAVDALPDTSLQRTVTPYVRPFPLPSLSARSATVAVLEVEEADGGETHRYIWWLGDGEKTHSWKLLQCGDRNFHLDVVSNSV